MREQKSTNQGPSSDQERFGGYHSLARDAKPIALRPMAAGTRWIEDFFKDCIFALRLLRKDRYYTIAATLALALGIGANAAGARTSHAR